MCVLSNVILKQTNGRHLSSFTIPHSINNNPFIGNFGIMFSPQSWFCFRMAGHKECIAHFIFAWTSLFRPGMGSSLCMAGISYCVIFGQNYLCFFNFVHLYPLT